MALFVVAGRIWLGGREYILNPSIIFMIKDLVVIFPFVYVFIYILAILFSAIHSTFSYVVLFHFHSLPFFIQLPLFYICLAVLVEDSGHNPPVLDFAFPLSFSPLIPPIPFCIATLPFHDFGKYIIFDNKRQKPRFMSNKNNIIHMAMRNKVFIICLPRIQWFLFHSLTPSIIYKTLNQFINHQLINHAILGNYSIYSATPSFSIYMNIQPIQRKKFWTKSLRKFPRKHSIC